MIRDIILARLIGVSLESDALFLVLSIFAIISAIFVDIINSSTFGVLKKIETQSENSSNFVVSLLVISTFLFIIIGTLNFYYPSFFLAPFKAHLSQEVMELTLRYSQLYLFTLVFFSISHLVKTIVKYHHDFVLNLTIELIRNAAVTAYLLIVSELDVVTYILVLLFSYFTEAVILIFILFYKYYRNIKRFSFDVENLKIFFFATIPAISMSFLYQINSYIDQYFISKLDVGNITYVNNANKIFSLFLGLFIFTINMISFSKMSRIHESKTLNTYVNNSVAKNIIISSFIVGYVVLSADNIIILFFDSPSISDDQRTVITSLLLIYTYGILAYAVRDILTKYYYQMLKTRLPFAIGVVAVLTNIALNIILVEILHVQGIILATSLSTFLSALTALFFSRKILELKYLLVFTIKTFLIFGVATYLTYLISHSIDLNPLVNIIINGIIFTSISLILLMLVFKKQEITTVLKFD